MRSISKQLTTVMLLTAALGVTGSCVHAQDKAAAAAGPQITRTEILTTPLEGIKDRDGVMYVTDIPPGLGAPRHSQSGDEFNYVVKGAVIIQVDGQKPITLKAGQGIFNAHGNIHTVKNASATEPAQIVAVLIHEPGKPLAILAP